MVTQQIEYRLGCLAFIAVAVTRIGMKPFRHFKIIRPCESKIKGPNRQPRASAVGPATPVTAIP